jgi:oligopeptide/dipeptide ABC transporter ATP-binding protein
LHPIYGQPPNLAFIPSGCAFHPRCQYAESSCSEVIPATIEVEPGHHVACHSIKDSDKIVKNIKIATN